MKTLAPCPKSPNCVSSRAADEKHAVAPLVFTGDADSAWKSLKAVVSSLHRTAVVEESDAYLRAESKSRIFCFVDDIEFLLDAEAHTIHVRSASRTGYSDMGVNRKRVEGIRGEMIRIGAVR